MGFILALSFAFLFGVGLGLMRRWRRARPRRATGSVPPHSAGPAA